MKNFLLAFVFSFAFMQASLSQTIVADTQTVDLDLGWSIFSTYIDPFEPSFDSVFAGIVQQNPQNIVIMKDDEGGIFWPYYNANTIGDFTIGKAYWAKMSIDTVVNIIGTAVDPQTPIFLRAGWNLMGYLPQNSSTAEFAWTELCSWSSPNLIVAIWDNGEVYWSLFNFTYIHHIYPGEGFRVKLNYPTYFSYPSGI